MLELPWNTVRLSGMAVTEKSGGPLAKVPICTFSLSTFPMLSKTRMHVSLPDTLEGEQLVSDGYEMSVVPVPTML